MWPFVWFASLRIVAERSTHPLFNPGRCPGLRNLGPLGLTSYGFTPPSGPTVRVPSAQPIGLGLLRGMVAPRMPPPPGRYGGAPYVGVEMAGTSPGLLEAVTQQAAQAPFFVNESWNPVACREAKKGPLSMAVL